jgi:hypothetical protein
VISKIINDRVQHWRMVSARAQDPAIEEEFAARIDRIRARFSLKLADKIQQTDAALPRMMGDGSGAVDSVATAYCFLHDVSGIGSTIGFEATGRVAQSCAAVLVSPFRAERGLSSGELALLTEGLKSLRITALNEVHPAVSSEKVAP